MQTQQHKISRKHVITAGDFRGPRLWALLLPTVMRFRTVWYPVSNAVRGAAAFNLTPFNICTEWEREAFIQHRERKTSQAQFIRIYSKSSELKEKCLWLLRNITMAVLLNTTPVRYRTSWSLMHYLTWFVPLYITRTWQGTWHFVQEIFLFWDCVSLPNVSETLYFSNSPMKRSHKPRAPANGLAKKCHQECPYIWKSLYGEWSVDSRPQIHVLINL